MSLIQPYLEDLESRIDPAVEDELMAEWARFADGGCREAIFSPRRRAKTAPRRPWPAVPINDTLDDMEKMALQQLAGCSGMLASGSGQILAVRCNYGTGILPTVFGAELFVMPPETNTLPTSVALGGGGATVMEALVAAAPPELRRGLGGRTLDMGRYFLDLLRPYPKASRYIHLYHPDLQGPMDVCELLWGSSLFLDIVDRPDLAKRVLERITDTYVAFMREWLRLVPYTGRHAVHWSLLHRGCVMLRDDSAMNFSPAMFDEFIYPYDQRVLREFGGGAMHFCGKGDHYIERATSGQGLFAVNLSQPEYNGMEHIFRCTVDRGVALVGLSRAAADTAVAAGRDLRGRVHCW